MQLQSSAIRALRTFAQTAIGVFLAGLVAAPALPDLANLDLLSSAVAAGVVAVLSFVQNALESLSDVSYNRG